jgi:hypothetical protein
MSKYRTVNSPILGFWKQLLSVPLGFQVQRRHPNKELNQSRHPKVLHQAGLAGFWAEALLEASEAQAETTMHMPQGSSKVQINPIKGPFKADLRGEQAKATVMSL